MATMMRDEDLDRLWDELRHDQLSHKKDEVRLTKNAAELRRREEELLRMGRKGDEPVIVDNADRGDGRRPIIMKKRPSLGSTSQDSASGGVTPYNQSVNDLRNSTAAAPAPVAQARRDGKPASPKQQQQQRGAAPVSDKRPASPKENTASNKKQQGQQQQQQQQPKNQQQQEKQQQPKKNQQQEKPTSAAAKNNNIKKNNNNAEGGDNNKLSKKEKKPKQDVAGGRQKANNAANANEDTEANAYAGNLMYGPGGRALTLKEQEDFQRVQRQENRAQEQRLRDQQMAAAHIRAMQSKKGPRRDSDTGRGMVLSRRGSNVH